MKKLLLTLVAVTTLALTGCYSSRSSASADPFIKSTPADYTISERFTAEASVTYILGIDWAHLFNYDGAHTNKQLSILGGYISNNAQGLAVRKLLDEHPGYDVVLYPQYETQTKFYVFYGTTTVKVSARLGKLK